MGAAQKTDAFLFQRGKDIIVEHLILPRDDLMRLFAHQLQGLARIHAVRPGGNAGKIDLLLQPGNADLEKFIQVAADDAQIF